MNTSYNIAVCESISVEDIFVGVWKAVIKRLLAFSPVSFTMADGADSATIEDNKAPPTLGITVGEEVQTTEALS